MASLEVWFPITEAIIQIFLFFSLISSRKISTRIDLKVQASN